MRDFRYGYEPYRRLEGELPALPPISHMELGRGDVPTLGRQPAFTNACVAPSPAEPVTVESLAHAYAALIDAVGPLPHPVPLYEPMKVETYIPLKSTR